MINGNTLMTTWSRETNGNTVRGVFRSYELVDGKFLPINVLSHPYDNVANDPTFFYFNNQIVASGPVNFTSSDAPTTSSLLYPKLTLFNSSLRPLGEAKVPIAADFSPLNGARTTSLIAFDKTRQLVYWSTEAVASSTTLLPQGDEYCDVHYGAWLTAARISSTGLTPINSSYSNYGVLMQPHYTVRNPLYFRGNSVTVSPNGRYITWLNSADRTTSYPESTIGLKIFDTGGKEAPWSPTLASPASLKALAIGARGAAGTSLISILSSRLPTHVQWTADSRYLITANAGLTAPINVFKNIDNDFVQASIISDIPRDIYNILASPDNRMLAVVVNGSDSNSKDTLLYKRTGSSFTLTQTINKFGLAISFNATGSILLDVSERRAYRLDDTYQFIEDTKLMSSVVAGATAVALSDHVPEPPVSGYIYDSVTPMVVKEHYQDNDLNICFLSSDAIFNRSDATIDNVTGVAANKQTMEVSGFGWPAGGKKLENVNFTPSSGSVVVTADNMSQDIAGGTLRFSKAVVYENKTKKPWLWFDFGHEVIVESGTTLSVEFSTKGFLVFTP